MPSPLTKFGNFAWLFLTIILVL